MLFSSSKAKLTLTQTHTPSPLPFFHSTNKALTYFHDYEETATFHCASSYVQYTLLQPEPTSVDADIQKEYARQREHLERSVASLKKKLTKDTEIHRLDNVRVMQVYCVVVVVVEDIWEYELMSKRYVGTMQKVKELVTKKSF